MPTNSFLIGRQSQNIYNTGNIARPLVLLHEALSQELVEELAGEEAVNFCANQNTFLLKDPNDSLLVRRRRQAVSDPDFGRGGAPKPGEPGYRESGLDLPYEQRSPRCMDLVLDCGLEGAVGSVQTCYTWINGVIKMAQECVAPNSFRIYMTKPPGRILKIAQKQWILCLQRRKQGLRC